jgi:protein TonB
MSMSITRQFLLAKSFLREPIWLAVTLSAALHVGAIAWMISPDPSPREIKVAGGQVIIEVAVVEGPERHPGADTGEERDRASPASAPARAAAQPDRHRAADQAADQTSDHVTDRVAVKDAPFSREDPMPILRSGETPMAATPSDPEAVALLQAPPPPPAKPAPPAPQPVALPPAQQALPQSRTDAADGKDSPSATANDGTVAPTEIAAHRGGTKGAAPRGDNPKPEYPFIARKRGYQGRVVLRVDVLPNGTADSVELESSSGYDSLDAAAVRTVRQWRFVPARRSGKPVAAAVTVPVLFKLY